jgi:hypothetical protein
LRIGCLCISCTFCFGCFRHLLVLLFCFLMIPSIYVDEDVRLYTPLQGLFIGLAVKNQQLEIFPSLPSMDDILVLEVTVFLQSLI